MVFLDLPHDILLEIFSHFVKPQHLASLCLVNNSFRTLAVCKLYDRVYIYSCLNEGKSKAMKLFYTLSQHPYLALLVHRLEIRGFPKATIYTPRYVLTGLKNCTNLRSCTWTPDGSLNSSLLKALRQCKNLRELELNGYINRNYDLQLLLEFTELHRISLINPNESVVRQLKPWLSATGATLRSLSLISQFLDFFTDGILEAIAPSLVNLEYLNLTGCHNVTHHGVWAIVSSSTDGLLGLTLEGVYHKFDVSAFADLCISSGALRRLRSFTMSTFFLMYLGHHVKHFVHLLSDSPLEIFQIHSCAWTHGFSVTDELWTQLLLAHGKRLLRISVHRAAISREAVHSICLQCTKLEQLFLFVQPNFLDELASFLSFAKALRTIHMKINDPYSFVLTQSQALSILNKCSPTVTQFGYDAQVWQVSRAIEVNEDGSINAHRTLVPYESPGIPEQFLIVQPIIDTRMLLHQLSVA